MKKILLILALFTVSISVCYAGSPRLGDDPIQR